VVCREGRCCNYYYNSTNRCGVKVDLRLWTRSIRPNSNYNNVKEMGKCSMRRSICRKFKYVRCKALLDLNILYDSDRDYTHLKPFFFFTFIYFITRIQLNMLWRTNTIPILQSLFHVLFTYCSVLLACSTRFLLWVRSL
jgi:hypothetical protein